MRAMTKASLQSIIKSPSAIIFTVAFPLIFILVFGFLGKGGDFNFSVADAPGCDTTSKLYTMLHTMPVLKWVKVKDSASLVQILKKGDIIATVNIKSNDANESKSSIFINYVANQELKTQQLRQVIESIMMQMDPVISSRKKELIDIEMKALTSAGEYKRIDFILPGQLSFSLLASGVFGTAFVFFNLRQTLVLKRFFATPVRREMIVISEGISRMLFQILGAIVIICVGHYVFGFTLRHDLLTFFQMLILCCLGLFIFMGFGFIISGVAKTESAIPPLSNIITMPQFLLAGTFFPIENFPAWLQPFCRFLPLSYLNDALRLISFDGYSLWDVRIDVLVLLIWGFVVYFIAGKTFKWE